MLSLPPRGFQSGPANHEGTQGQSECRELPENLQKVKKKKQEVLEVIVPETISTFQRGCRLGNFKKDLIVQPAQDLRNLSARAKRYMTLEESLAISKEGQESIRRKAKGSP
ncbi:hypothetical protein CRG98_034542 [Punica granatum]|uniref:Uncharacterized protein n=1 Tax=Punica granatum TaxID=22663 RepID=A0A2I0IN21_PUNGR|nr:hypothetical protein CRG98_034542 [Punica granatum]